MKWWYSLQDSGIWIFPQFFCSIFMSKSAGKFKLTFKRCPKVLEIQILKMSKSTILILVASMTISYIIYGPILQLKQYFFHFLVFFIFLVIVLYFKSQGGWFWYFFQNDVPLGILELGSSKITWDDELRLTALLSQDASSSN